MLIKKLTLEGYNNFHLRGIKKFVYTPQEKTQIVLGSNGSGKTSLLKELSPLPADHRLYSSTGSKVIEISFQGKEYVLSSLFNPDGHRYLFSVDGVEQNPGESISVYRELVKAHFKYTPDVHELLIDVISFDMLDVAKRRALFMRMSDQDFTYPVKYFKKLSESARDLHGSIKLDKEKLVKENDRLLSPEDEQRVREDIADVREIIQTLLSERLPKLQNIENHNNYVNVSIIELIDASMRLEKLIESIDEGKGRLKGDNVPDALIELDKEIAKKSNEQSSLTALISSSCQQVARLEKSLSQVKDQSQQKLEFLVEEMEQLGKNVEEIRKGLRIDVVYDDPKGASEQIPLALDIVESIKLEFDDIETLDPSAGHHSEMEREASVITDRLRSIQTAMEEISKKLHTLKHYKSRGDTECPNCHHTWIPNYDPKEVYTLDSIAEALRKERSELTDRLEFLQKQTAIILRNVECRRKLRECIRNFPALTPLFNYSAGEESLLHAILRDLRTARTEIGDHLKIYAVQEKVSALGKEIATRTNVEPGDADILSREIAEIEQTLHGYQDRSRALTEEIHQDRKLRAILASSISLSEKIIKTHQALKGSLKKEVIHHLSGIIDELITMHNLRLTSLERSITTIDIQKGIVASLEKTITSKEADHKLLKAAVTALSPTEGLIAKAMGGFINRFVGDINRFIADFWLYPLTLEPVDLGGEEIDLDYKFMVRVNSTHVVKDIQEASRGMREIINLAMRATCMKYLGLRNYPLFLDEFAARMDVAHRKAAYEAIDKLIESEEYSQIFLVSHYQEGYGALTDAEILVLCDSNVRMPKDLDFNKHVDMLT